jgi:hypothetical protein
MKMARPWWSTPSPNVTPCAVLYFHIGKTGGGSIVSWLMRHNPRFTLKLDYARSRLFLALHADLFPYMHVPWELNGGKTAVGPKAVWQASSVAVEYHGTYPHAAFWTHVVPALPALRRRYAAAGGRVVTLTTLRDPVPHIVSWYRQWPPRRPRKAIAPFVPWLANASGLLTRALGFVKGPARIWHTTRVPHFACAAETVALATQRTRETFDLVGDVADVSWTLRSVVDCLGWPRSALPAQTPHVAYDGAQRQLTLRETSILQSTPQARAGVAADADAPRCRLERAARCDRTLYEAARGSISGQCRRKGVPREPPARSAHRRDEVGCR